jgi:hypothetical protein
MANIHVLKGEGDNTYLAVIHIAVTSGNNLVGVPYRTAMVNAGLNTTIMPQGAGPGQITTAEFNSLLSGAIYETSFFFGNNPDWTTTERMSAFNGEVSQRTNQATAFITNALAYFGHTA